MDSDTDRRLLETEDRQGIDDPLVPAYRTSGPERGIVHVRQSELAKDKSLLRTSKSARSPGFDPLRTLSASNKAPLPGDSYVERKIQFKLMLSEIKNRIKTEQITFNSLASNLHGIESMDDPAAHYILMLVTDQLKDEGLWRDEDKDLTMSEAFPLSQAKTDPRFSSDDSKVIKHGTFLSDAELTHEDLSSPNAEPTNHLGFFSLPALATPMLHNLMRASPRDLYHQIARRMMDTNYFEDRPEDMGLYRACVFASKGVEDEIHFSALMQAGLGERFPHYTFNDFRIERVPLRKRIRELIGEFFTENPAICRCLKKRPEVDKQDPKNIWIRFYQVWESLTSKQREALEAVHMNQDTLTRAEAARKFGITIDSLVSRLRSAIQKFKAEFWELEGISPKRLPRTMLTGALTHNNLWRYQSAAWRATLYKVDLKDNLKVEIEWHKLPKSRNLDWKTVARIKAQIIENCPVPYIHDTEYFDGMRPTIISFGRKPGNLTEGSVTVFDPDEGFRHIE